MSEWRSLNTNDYVRVKLTALGERIWCDYWGQFAAKDSPGILSRKIVDGWFEEQLWVIASIFGPHMGNGMPVPFETEIQVKV